MSESLYNKSMILIAALNILPPIVRDTLLQNTGFQNKYKIQTDAEISFNNFNILFQRSELYDAVRNCLSDSMEKSVVDNKGGIWKVKNIKKDGELPHVYLSNKLQNIELSNLCVLSTDRNTRISCLNKIVSDVNLPSTQQEYWRDILFKRILNDDEISLFESDINDTPVQFMRLVENILLSENFDISSLVPNSRRYFERLVGTFDGSISIHEYAKGQARVLFKQLSQWRSYEGLLFSLFLSSQSVITSEISVNYINNQNLLKVFEEIENSGDKISHIGVIELGLQLIKSRPEIEPVLLRLIHQININNKESEGGFKLTYALFVLVDGELSRSKLFKSEPPFYRRLASLSQAALLYGLVVDSNINIDSFCKWCLTVRGKQFYLQSLADLRLEPRWYPDFAESSQIRADLLGRVMIAARENKHNLTTRLSEILFGSNNSINSQIKFPDSYFPGPLEGAIDKLNTLPVEISSSIEAQLSEDELTPASFATLVNSALIFSIDANHAELAANALRDNGYRLKNVEDRLQLLGILNGLAKVAAISRSESLTEELRVLVRGYLNDLEYAISIDEVIRICLISAASYTDIGRWSSFVGNWLTELAFSNLKADDGRILHSIIKDLCDIVPQLWITCGRADAALKALNGSDFKE